MTEIQSRDILKLIEYFELHKEAEVYLTKEQAKLQLWADKYLVDLILRLSGNYEEAQKVRER